MTEEEKIQDLAITTLGTVQDICQINQATGLHLVKFYVYNHADPWRPLVCRVITSQNITFKVSDTVAFRVVLAPSKTDDFTMYGTVRYVVAENHRYYNVTVDVHHVGNTEVKETCCFLMTQGLGLKKHDPITFRVLPSIEISGMITDVKKTADVFHIPDNDFYIFDVDTTCYAQKQVCKSLTIKTKEFGVYEKGRYIHALIIYDGDELVEIPKLELSNPTPIEPEPEPKRGIIYRLCLWICEQCGWLDPY